MTYQRHAQRPRLWGLLCGLTLAVAQFFSPAGLGTAQAATTSCTPNAVQNCTITFAYKVAPPRHGACRPASPAPPLTSIAPKGGQ